MNEKLTAEGDVRDGATGTGSRRNPIETRIPDANPREADSEGPPESPKSAQPRGGAVGWKSRCGAKTRKGTPCQRPPLAGRTRCRLHGGASPVGMAHYRYKHGRRSKFFSWWPEALPREEG
jgi:hypothetical protein